MRYDIRYLQPAYDDLDSIASYLTQFYPGTLSRFFLKLECQVASLQNHPELNQIYDDDPYYRCMPISDYLVFCFVDHNKKNVDIHRILRDSWNIEHYLPQKP